jgi:hypothetical protein
MKKLQNPTDNTVNKVNKFVTVFANCSSFISEIDSIETTPLYIATANLAHLLLRDTPPSAQVKAKSQMLSLTFLL